MDRVDEKHLAKTFAQVMEDAAKLLEKRGQCQFAYRGLDGSICTKTAITRAEGYEGDPSVYTSRITERLERWLAFNLGEGGICSFNNHHSQQEVVAMLRRAAVEA